MDVTLAEERVLVLPDQIDMAAAEARAATKRIDAFGTLAKVAGLLSRPRAEDFELVYKEHRLQPFWFAACTAVCAYERTREHVLKLAPEVRQATISGQAHEVSSQQLALPVLEHCREETRHETYYDALTGKAAPELADRLGAPAAVSSPEALAALAEQGTVVVPPQTKASVVVREILAGLMGKIEADKVLEETVGFERIDLYYRPVFAFRYRRQGKEAVVEVDGLTGEAKAGGATFETYLGRVMDPRFLIEMGAESAALFVPGAGLVKVLVFKGMDMKGR